MDKIAKVPHLREELDWLDQTYGVEKEGFFHQEHSVPMCCGTSGNKPDAPMTPVWLSLP